MIQRELFGAGNIEQEQRIPQRPLGEVSNFVVEELPHLLMEINSQRIAPDVLLQRVTSMLANLSESRVEELLSLSLGDTHESSTEPVFDQRLDQAALDLKMLEVALVSSQLPVPAVLTQLVDRFSEATNQLPMISYEDLIYINPESDPRTFTAGAIGKSEHDFYYGHLRIEHSLKKVIDQVKQAIHSLQQPQPEIHSVVLLLHSAAEVFRDIQRDLQAIGMSLPKDHFAEFRKFLTSHPLRNLKGPSGAYTSAIPVLDMLLGGENLEPQYFNHLIDNSRYFPRLGRIEIAAAFEHIQKGETLASLSADLGDPADLVSVIQALSDQVKLFRTQHYRGVSHQIPEAVAGNLSGTGGEENPGQFLRKRIKTKHLRGKNDIR